MSGVLEFFRKKEPRFRDVSDERLATFVADAYPEFLQHPEFREQVQVIRRPPSLQLAPQLPERVMPSPSPATAPAFDPATMADNATQHEQAQAARREEELQATLRYHPLYRATQTLGRAGRVTLAGAADLASLYPGGTAPTIENLASFANRPEAPMPVEQGLEELRVLGDGFWSGAAALGAKTSAAVLQTAPALGATAGLGALGASPAAASGLAFGAREEGFDPIGAAIAAGLPGVTKAGEQFVARTLERLPTAKVVVEVLSHDPLKLKGKVVQRLGNIELSNDAFRKYLEAGGGLIAANAYLGALALPDLMQLPPEQRHEAALEMAAANVAMSLAGFTSRKGTSLTLENMMPRLRAEWVKANERPGMARPRWPVEEGAPVPSPDLPARYDPFAASEPPAAPPVVPPVKPAPPAPAPVPPEQPAPVRPEPPPEAPAPQPQPSQQPKEVAPAPAFVPPGGAPPEAAAEPVPTTDPGHAVADYVAERLRAGETVLPLNVRNLGGTRGLDERQSGEWAELGATEVAREIARQPDLTAREKFFALVNLYDRMPTHGERTVETKTHQQYSTPPPLAWVGNVLADFAGGTGFADPTAGHGMLMMGAPASGTVAVNELDRNRAARLARWLAGHPGGKSIAAEDATNEVFSKWLASMPGGLNRVGQNPPFGSVLDPATNKPKQFPIINAATKARTTTSIDLAIALNTFEAMTKDGKGFAIIGSKTGTPFGGTFGADKQRAADYRRPVMMEFFERFNVVDWFTIGGDLYRKMGAAWPVDMIVVHGKGRTPRADAGGVARPWVKPPRVIETWEQLAQLIPETSNENIRPRPGTGETGASPGGTRPSPPVGTGPAAGPREPAVSPDRPQRPPGQLRPGGGTPTPPPAPSPNPTPAPPPVSPGDSSTGIGTGTPQPAGPVAQGGAKGGKPGSPAVGGTGPVAAGSGKADAGKSGVTPEAIKRLIDKAVSQFPGVFREVLDGSLTTGVAYSSANGYVGYNLEQLLDFAKFNADHGADAIEHVRLSIDEELAHYRDALATQQQNELQTKAPDKQVYYYAHHAQYFKSVPQNVKQAVSALYPPSGPSQIQNDTLQMSELIRMKDQLRRLNKTTETALGGFAEMGMDRAVNVIRDWKPAANIQAHLDQVAKAGVTQSQKQKPTDITDPKPKLSVSVEGLPASLMVPFQSVSKGPSLNLVAPRNIATQMQAAALQLEQQVGMPIDDYVAGKLGRDVKTLHTQLAGAQVDTAALAIRDIERGSALICAHETGVGKGRVVAALIEYARMRGLIPVFVTAKPNLFEDMIARDLPALGNKDFKAFITNAKYAFEDAHGREVKGSGTAASRNAEMEQILRTGNLPAGAQGVFTTYDQLKSDKPAGWSEDPKAKFKRKGGRDGKNARPRPDGPRFAMLRALAPRAIFILDESHLAAGPTSEVNLSLSTILPQARGIYYSSATFAKRPDNLGIYALGTLMSRTGLNHQQMTEALHNGGVPLQQALTSMLAESGELIRAQQDWTGVPMSFESTAANPAAVAREVEAADTYTSFIRDLITLNKQVNAAGAALEDGENQVRAEEQQVRLQAINPMARLFNLSNQYLFALRADAVANKAIAELKAGRKPFIHVHNTLEGPLLDLRARKLPMNFQGILLREMQKMLTLTVRDPMAEDGKREVELSPEDLPDGGAFYRRLEAQIKATDLSEFPISPIDHIKKKIQAAGYSMGEITARDGEVDDSGGEITIAKRDKAARNKILKSYNDGQLDVLLINGSGGTGLSAHTDPKFKDQRQRSYIEGQPAPDINDEMQAMGRTMRSGQTSKPKYTFPSTALAAERRFATMLRGKMTSLNANTTAEGESGLTQQEGFADDIFNEIGDAVVFRVMQANPVESNLMDLGTGNEDAESTIGFARQATGRFVLLPNDDAQRLWDEIIAEYRDEIQRLDEEGQNPLRATAEDLRARTIETQEIVAASGDTLFDGAATLEKAIVRPPKAPPTHEAAIQRARDNMPVTRQRVNEWLDKSKAAERDRVAAAEARGQSPEQIDRIRANMQAVREAITEAYRKLGDTFGVDKMGDGNNSFYGVAAELKLADRQVSDYSSLSRQELILTANTFSGRYRIPLSKLFKNGEEQPLLNLIDEDAAAEQFNTTAESNAERHIITGNLLRGWEAASSATSGREMGRPRVAIYTREDGSLNTGILMPPGWTPGEGAQAQELIQDPRQFAMFLRNQTPMRSLPTSSVHPVQVVAGRLAVPSSGQGKLLWGDPAYQDFFVKPPQQLAGNFVGVIGADPAKLFAWLNSKGVRLVVKPEAETAAMRGPGGGAASRGAFVSGVPRTPGTVPPTVQFGGMQHVRPLQMPELVRIVRELTGLVPKVRKFPSRGKQQTLGQFGDGMISLDPRIFKDPEVAAKVLAHELGHLVDYLPHETLKRGNLLGHLLALRGWLKAAFGPLNNNDIKTELLAVTKWWRPYDEAADPKAYVKYRQSPEELYADALSVLFNAPGELEARAPKFYQAFWENLEKRPEVMDALFAVQDLLNKGMPAVIEARKESVLGDFLQGEAAWRQAVAERENRQVFKGWWNDFWQGLYWQFNPMRQRAALIEKRGGNVPFENDPRVFLDALGYRDTTVRAFGRAFYERVLQPLEAAGLDFHEDFGYYLFLNRIWRGDRVALEQLRESADGKAWLEGRVFKGDRQLIANPNGYTPEAASQDLLKLRLDLGMNKMTLLEHAVQRFHELFTPLTQKLVDVGAINKQVYETQIKPNEGFYAPFAVVDYIVDLHMPAGVRKQFGTLKGVANPAQAAFLKAIAAINLIAYQEAKNKTIDFDSTYGFGDFTPFPHDRAPLPREVPHDKGVFMRLENGRPKWYLTDPWIAEAFEKLDPGTLSRIVYPANWAFKKIVYPLIITYKTSFGYFTGPLRDIPRAFTNLPAGQTKFAAKQLGIWALNAGPIAALGYLGGLTGAMVGGPVGAVVGAHAGGFAGIVAGNRLARLSKLARSVQDRYRGVDSPLIREMEANLALGTPFDLITRLHRDDFMGDLLRRARVLSDHQQQGFLRSKVFSPVRALLNEIEIGSMALNEMVKAGAYQTLRRAGYRPNKAGHWVRNYAGQPNLNKRGTLFRAVKAFDPFWNVAVQGWAADAKLFTEPNTRTGWWLRYMLSSGLIRIAIALAVSGALGEWLKDRFKRISKWNLHNYINVPIGEVAGGEFGSKVAALRLPENETARMISGVLHIAITQGAAKDFDATEFAGFAMTQIPGISPTITTPQAWLEFAQGHNPVDPWSGNQIVPDRVWDANDWHRWTPMMSWTLKQSGAANFVSWDPKSETTLELTASAVPGVNKFLLVTDQGMREEQRAQQNESQAARARERLKLPATVQSLEMEYWQLNRLSGRTEQQAERYADLKFWYARYYRPAWESLERAIEDNTPAAAAAIRRQLEKDSSAYYRDRR